ncbi:MAG: PilC/PilY family type IV pilus protein, partial [Burkholderiales bacterium]
DTTTTSTRTVVTSNGVVTSDTTSTGTSSANVSTNTTVDSDTFPAWADYSSASISCESSSSLTSPNPSSPTKVSTKTLTTSGPTTTTLSTTGPTTGATTTTTTSSGGTSNTLADVSEYYYINDLRTTALGNCTGAPIPPATTGIDVCTNDVPQSGLDGASWQHMTTFTLGLGASGYMQFSPNYPNATSGDYFDVKNGTTANPTGGICSWQSSGACNWPVPVSNEQTTIDDLWHAAVNGRGTYFSATNPASLNAGLSSALAGVSARTGSSAAATTSNPNVTSGDNFVFSSTFTTQEWDGQLEREQLDLTTGIVSSTADWKARDQLDTNTSRNIYTFDATAGNKLKAFDWASLSTAEQAYFTTPNISTLSQFCVTGITCLSAADQTAASGQPLVNFLRGDRSNEGISTDTTKYFRQRTHVLGDIVNAEAVYVKRPLFNYADAGYSAYITAQATRQGVVYAAANDGMLHAFNADTGAEMWAYVPSMVLPSLYKLADKNYSGNHQYFVDGTPVAGDVYFGGAWHTIVVGGLNGGGRGYYALDVTNPAAPVALWEFTDANLGYTYGNPTITKLTDGTWVVLMTSGYNNVAPGDGVGRLYVLNAGTGALIRSISTGVGDTTTPSGLARISAWVTNATSDNTALRVYGGDLLGNLWRFDINGNVGAAGYDAQRLVTLYANAAGTITQPITTRPELGDIAGVAVVFVGTGRFLGVGDLTDTTQQTFYAVKDTLGTTTYSNPQASGSNFVQQVVSNGTCPTGSPATICTLGQSVRTSTNNTVNFATNNGWYVNLPDSGERANTDPNLALGTLGFTTNVPNTSACTAGGYSYRYVLDYRTGAPVSTSTTGVSAIKLGNALSTRGVFVRLPNNTVVQLTRLSDGTTMTTNVPIGAGVAPVRRISWRELIQDQ